MKANPTFVNKVWTVAESKQVAPGDTRVFLSDGTLVMTSPHATPAFGSWRYADGRLTIVEEGQEYPVDILDLSESAFRIRMLSPGEPVEILFAPAEQLPPETIASAQPATLAQAQAPQPVALWGTAWRLENLAGAGVLDRVQATLEFPSEGRASGNGSCNRFNGVVTIEGDTITFGGLATTRKACLEAVMRQEDAYLAALRDAERFEIDGQTLLIHVKDRPEPLRYAASDAMVQGPAKQIERSTASATPALTGIWTVVAHHSPGVSAVNDDAGTGALRRNRAADRGCGDLVRQPLRRTEIRGAPGADGVLPRDRVQAAARQPEAARGQEPDPADGSHLRRRAPGTRSAQSSSKSTPTAHSRPGTVFSSSSPAIAISGRSDRNRAGSSRSARAPRCA